MKLTYETYQKSLQHVKEMLTDRRFLTFESNIGVSTDPESEFNQITKDSLPRLIATKPKTKKQDQRKIGVWWVGESKLRIKIISFLKSQLTELGLNRCIIVTDAAPTAQAKNVVNNLESNTFSLFTLKEMQFNVTKHVLVPKHEALSTKQKIEVLKQFRLTPDKTPKIYTTDPIVRYYGWPRGTLVKITRGGGEIFYRIVVKGVVK